MTMMWQHIRTRVNSYTTRTTTTWIKDNKRETRMDKELLEKELAPFLSPNTKEEIKTIAVENVVGLTGSEEGKTFLKGSERLLEGLVSLTEDKRTDIQESVFKALINLMSDEETCWTILNLEKFENKFTEWLQSALDSSCKNADNICKLLSNLTRSEKCAGRVSQQVLENDDISIEKIVLVLCNLAHNPKADLHYLGAVLENLSQIREVRCRIMDKERCIMQRLLPFTEFKQSSVRRGGIIGTLKNCCFDTEYHEWLLGDQVDILPRLLLPLAGPEEFDDDDMERLPDDLQYLPSDKQREPDAYIRKMLTEAILQLCATKKGKKFVKDKNTYVIMREYYAWERKIDHVNEIAAMSLIDVLIGDEPSEEFGDNLKEVDIPEDIQQDFLKQDQKELEYAYKEQREKLEENCSN
ncbi:protein HGH1 homolog isoform X2 [Mercenaria mercenaria]|uniref:protein HGH1 homolog isoform X2 n=1 Tax=Mercenaria mercenaria TaxID=6596 RepID=UPI00234E7CA6|nr:protein HGH1 homolog isoform X2 [Mercenaria mercenaria]